MRKKKCEKMRSRKSAKNKMGTKADLIKQSCWAQEEATEEGKIISATELSGNHRNRMYCLSQNEIFSAALQSKSRRINLFERNIVENSVVSKLLIESSGENSPLNERPKWLRYSWRLNRIFRIMTFF